MACPSPGKGQVLVRVKACALNGSDKEFLNGRPAYARVMGLRRPRISVLGSDIAGTVEALGEGVFDVEVGDKVFADAFDHWGGLAEFAAIPADRLMPIPDGLSFAQAACLPQPAAISWEGVHIKGNVAPGDDVLINGAGGACGILAVQLAKLAGAHVTAVDHHRTLQTLESLGADKVLDYRRTDFAKEKEAYDVVIDLFATRPARALYPVLKANGRYLAVGGWVPTLLNLLFFGSIRRMISNKSVGILAAPPNRDHTLRVAELVATGAVQTFIGGTYSLEDAAKAFQDKIDGQLTGKAVIIP